MLLFLFFFGLALGAVSSSDVPAVKLQRGNCPLFWYSFKGRCYKYVSTRMTWGDAELHCVSLGTNLVSIRSLDEDNYIRNLVKNFDPHEQWTWIGLSDLHREGRWMWSDGCPVKVAFWDAEQPDNNEGNEHCGHINYGPAKKWNDNECIVTLSFVCASRKACS